MAKQKKRIKELQPWFWIWRRTLGGSVFCGLVLGNALQLPKEDLAFAVRVLLAPATCTVRRMCGGEPLTTTTAIMPRSKWSRLLLRIALQDALSEVTKNYPPLKLRVFVDDITALLKRKNKVVAEMAKKLMKILKEEVERKGLNLSVTEDGKEGKSKMIASCGFLEDELRQFSGEEGVTMADSVDSLGVDLRTRVNILGAKEKARRQKCWVRFSLIKNNR